MSKNTEMVAVAENAVEDVVVNNTELLTLGGKGKTAVLIAAGLIIGAAVTKVVLVPIGTKLYTKIVEVKEARKEMKADLKVVSDSDEDDDE